MSRAARPPRRSAPPAAPPAVPPAAPPATGWPAPPQGKWTRADYLRLPESPARAELIDGALIVASAPCVAHQEAVGNLYFALRRHLAQARAPGQVFLAPCDVFLNAQDSVQPDLIYVAPDHQGIVTPRRIEGVPDALMEVVAPGGETQDRQRKRRLYRNAGVGAYWIVDPAARQIEVLVRRAGEPGYVGLGPFAAGAQARGEAIEGFAVAVEEICHSKHPMPPEEAAAHSGQAAAAGGEAEVVMRLRDVPAKLAELYGGKPVTRQAVYQWVQAGIKKKLGGRKRLQIRRMHGQLFTTLAWVREFVETK